MKIIRLTEQLQFNSHPRVLCIGVFDGCHLGHQRLLQEASKIAGSSNALNSLLTFEPLPQVILQRHPIEILTNLKEKVIFLRKKALLDELYILRFSKNIQKIEASEFVEDWIMAKLAPKVVVVGADFRFGKNAEGNVSLLEKILHQYDCKLVVLPDYEDDTGRISSTRIRTALSKDDFVSAEKMLGRPYTMSGKVSYGRQLARILGFPTINIHPHRHYLPLQGVYAVKVMIEGYDQIFLGVANIGYRPTVDGVNAMLEIHLLDVQLALYGACCTVEFCAKIRAEQKFAGLTELKYQISQDIVSARQIFNL